VTDVREFMGTRLAVIFNLMVPTPERHTVLMRAGNPILHSHDSTGVYIIGVPDGQDYHWLRTYRAILGVVSAEFVRPVPGQR
jgi:hypothetical protein